jgi:hypothetical protein
MLFPPYYVRFTVNVIDSYKEGVLTGASSVYARHKNADQAAATSSGIADEGIVSPAVLQMLGFVCGAMECPL